MAFGTIASESTIGWRAKNPQLTKHSQALEIQSNVQPAYDFEVPQPQKAKL